MKGERKTVAMHLECGVAAALLGMSRQWVKAKIRSGDLEGFALGNRIIVSAESINRYLEKCRLNVGNNGDNHHE